MTRDCVQGNWKQIAGKTKEQWGNLTGGEIGVAGGSPRPAFGSERQGALLPDAASGVPLIGRAANICAMQRDERAYCTGKPMRPAGAPPYRRVAHTMIHIDLHVELSYEVDEHGADFVFNIHAAHTPHQAILAENLVLSQSVVPQVQTDPVTGNRYMRLRAMPGALKVIYTATVELDHHSADPDQLAEVPVQRLPLGVFGYIVPSRYCQSDRLIKLAVGEFGQLRKGHSRVQAIRDWVKDRVAFASSSTNSNTSAVDTLIDRVGVCRDFAHLMIALCRAVNIPARFATGTDYGADPMLGPPDFQAYVEAYLGDRWYIFDPSGTAIPMGFVRFGTGRDAADVAFATIFGGVRSQAPLIRATAIEDLSRAIVVPHHCRQALSTDSGWGAALSGA